MVTELIGAIETFLPSALRQVVPLTLAGIGVSFGEKAGILNIGEEGVMLCGAFGGFMIAFITGNLWLGMLGGLLISMIHAFLCIHCRANQTTVGLALNFFAQGLTSFLFLLAFGQGSSLPSIDKMTAIRIPVLADIPVLGILFEQNILVYILYLVVIVSTVVYIRQSGA